jgi:hypothetical protein
MGNDTHPHGPDSTPIHTDYPVKIILKLLVPGYVSVIPISHQKKPQFLPPEKNFILAENVEKRWIGRREPGLKQMISPLPPLSPAFQDNVPDPRALLPQRVPAFTCHHLLPPK